MVSQDRNVIDVLVGDNTRIHAQLMGEALKRDRFLRVIGSAAGSREFLEMASRHSPHVALLSATMDEDPNLGITTLRQFHAAHPNIPASGKLCWKHFALARVVFSANTNRSKTSASACELFMKDRSGPTAGKSVSPWKCWPARPQYALSMPKE